MFAQKQWQLVPCLFPCEVPEQDTHPYHTSHRRPFLFSVSNDWCVFPNSRQRNSRSSPCQGICLLLLSSKLACSVRVVIDNRSRVFFYLNCMHQSWPGTLHL